MKGLAADDFFEIRCQVAGCLHHGAGRAGPDDDHRGRTEREWCGAPDKTSGRNQGYDGSGDQGARHCVKHKRADHNSAGPFDTQIVTTPASALIPAGTIP